MNNALEHVEQKLAEVPAGQLTVIFHHPDGTQTVRRAEDAKVPAESKLLTEAFDLYPGIRFSYHYYLADCFHFPHRHGCSLLSVDHCRTGRIGWEMIDGLSLYYGGGDLSFHFTDKCSDSRISLHLGYY